MVDLYAVLGVTATADAGEIRRAYLRLVRRYHPDRDVSPESTEHFLQVQAAYDALGDAAKRQRYDARIAAPRFRTVTTTYTPEPRSAVAIPRGRVGVKVRMH
ncbi:J domain-containing protein [Corallococcus carmarthensis]|uniref:J domain-containing protein n=1 Tax=Corallococcus carmarthensis TaxID=2316728 RepID=A0A3A8KA74_9BACT|nr:J domain-containing protein [Corallococcus carmarthensis]NOK16019.1 J domain-containing protein [Corallococcus carmarthensis]RKH04890.1 J domain-containing protein [Corallococcus carmarthensis]